MRGRFGAVYCGCDKHGCRRFGERLCARKELLPGALSDRRLYTQPPRVLATSAVRHTDALGSTTRYFLPALPVELFRAALQVAAQSWNATSI
jgi:hypothetical protein